MFLADPETVSTTTEDLSDSINATSTTGSTLQTLSDTNVSRVLPTSTTNVVDIIASDFGFDQSRVNLTSIKIIILSFSIPVVAIVLTAATVLVAVTAIMGRRRCVRWTNSRSASTTVAEMETQKGYCNTSMGFIMTDNVSYNICACDIDALSHRYEYPDLSTTILDESNIYDSIDSQ